MPPLPDHRLRRADILLLAIVCTLLFGYVSFSGRPMTLHEARLPECAREMIRDHQWIFPHSGGRPWLERPPFPHWVMIAFAAVLGRPCDTEWAARIPAAAAGLLIVLLVAGMTARWFGRGIAVVAGLVLATSYEFYYYSTLAEDDIFLALLVVSAVACFVVIDGVGSSPSPGTADRRSPGEGRGEGLSPGHRWHLLGLRPGGDWLLFFLIGLTNLAKGPLVGAAVVIATLGVYLLTQIRWRAGWQAAYARCSRYIWLWGWLLALVVGASWHIAAARLFPGPGGYVANLRYDFYDTTEFDNPFYYYPGQILARVMPWTPAALVGLVLLWRRRRDLATDQIQMDTDSRSSFNTSSESRVSEEEKQKEIQNVSASPVAPDPRQPICVHRSSSVATFLLTWAIMPILVLSIPHRKSHQYLVPSLAPWAILAALGAQWIAAEMFSGPAKTRHPLFGLLVFGLPIATLLLIFRHHIPGPPWIALMLACIWILCVIAFYTGLTRQNPRWLMAALVLGVGVAYSWGQTCWRNQETQDTIFLREVETIVPHDKPLLINAAIGPLEFFRIQFYLRPQAQLIQNLSYLHDEKYRNDPEVYVVARNQDLPVLRQMGDVIEVAQSKHARKDDSPAVRWTLFRIRFDPNLKRYPAPPVDVMQAMLRQPGPWCGPAL